MMYDRSFTRHDFTIADPDARLRDPNNLLGFLKTGNSFQTIPRGTTIKVDDLRAVEAGAKSLAMFVHAVGDDGSELGWTSANNLAGHFVNETLDLRPALDNNRFGANAAWSRGEYLGQVELVEIVSAKQHIERISTKSFDAYWTLVEAAKTQRLEIAINSGFRSWGEQRLLFDGFSKGLPGFNTAAKPGFSKHQNGIAFDINVPGGAGNPTYDWLTHHGPALGFLRTVNKEPWHWEFDPERAAIARANGTFKLASVLV